MVLTDYADDVPAASCAIINGPTLDDLHAAHETGNTQSTEQFSVRFMLQPEMGKPSYEVTATITELKKNGKSWEVTGFLTHKVPASKSDKPRFKAWYVPEESRGYLVAA